MFKFDIQELKKYSRRKAIHTRLTNLYMKV